VPPNLRAAIGLSVKAFRSEAWLAALGLVVAGLRRALGWPALVLAVALVVRGAVSLARHAPGDPGAPIEGAIVALTAPRMIGLVGGLWLAGAVASWALRVAWLSGALPVLGARMAGAPSGTAGFAAGLAGRFHRVLAASVLAAVLELSGTLFAATVFLGAALFGVGWFGGAEGAALPFAALTALALTLAVAVSAALSIAADAVVARAAVRGEWPAAALAGASRRFLARPGAFLLAGMTFGLALLAGRLAVSALGSLATGFAASAPPGALVGPELMLGVLAALVAAMVEVLWLGTVTALACAGSGRPA
jgi:hypothetical protein